jgi:transcription factor STE12
MPHQQAPPQQSQHPHSHHSHSHSLSSSASAYAGDDASWRRHINSRLIMQHYNLLRFWRVLLLILVLPQLQLAVLPCEENRSMTPSLIRNGDPIRRPMTSVVDGGGSGGSPSSMTSSSLPRGYHPYAYSATNSRAGSTHSSPPVHPTPLSSEDYGPKRSDSRNSSYSVGGANGGGGGGGGIPGGLHEQMRQLMSMENPRRDSNGATVVSVFGDSINSLFSAAASSDLFTGATSTSSSSPSSSSLLSKPLSSTPPMMGMMTNTNVQTDSPASFSVVDLPTMVGGYVQGGYGGGGGSSTTSETQQQQQQQQHQYDGYYTQQQTHSTL